MQPEYIHQPETQVYYLRKVGSYQKTPSTAWKEIRDMLSAKGKDFTQVRCFGISHDCPVSVAEDKLRYDACISAEGGELEELKQQVIPGGYFAVFTHVGPFNTVGAVYDYIFSEWLPETNNCMGEGLTFCEYFNIGASNPTTKIYLPLA